MRWAVNRLADLLELPGQQRLKAMEGLRGIAVTLVFLVHYDSLFGDWLAPHSVGARVAEFLRTVGHSGVDLFFVLSGYLIYGAVISARDFSYARFMQRRLLCWATPIMTVFALPVADLLVAAPRMFDAVHYSARTASSLRTIWLFFALGTFTLAAFQPSGLLPRILSAAPLRWLGNMSYSYYLVHGLPLKAMTIIAHRVWQSGISPLLYWAAMPAMYACTLASALVLFASVEKHLSLTRSIHPFQVSSIMSRSPWHFPGGFPASFRFLRSALSGGWAWRQSRPSLRLDTVHDRPFLRGQ